MKNSYKTIGRISLVGGIYEILNWIYKVMNGQSNAIHVEPILGPILIILGIGLLYRFRNKKI